MQKPDLNYSSLKAKCHCVRQKIAELSNSNSDSEKLFWVDIHN